MAAVRRGGRVATRGSGAVHRYSVNKPSQGIAAILRSREVFHLERRLRKLAKAGVRVVSVNQERGDDPVLVMMRRVIAMF